MGSDSSTVSVALSVFNAGDNLRAQLDSILTQQVLPQEIVVGDDGSTDGSQELVAATVERSKRDELGITWTVLPPGPVGLHANMARIFDACTGTSS